MNRVFKFRVWAEGEMRTPPPLGEWDDEDHFTFFSYNKKPSIIMQFTGLKAYDGKAWVDVYEGDILLKHGKHSVVEWDGVFLTRKLMTPKGFRNYILQHHELKEDDATKLDGFRHCGNIHENPDLIK